MGKKAKEHKKKVAARNERIKVERAKFQKTYETMMREKLEEMAKGFNSLDNVEVVDMIENGESIMGIPTEEQ
jgi:hypothetical protein